MALFPPRVAPSSERHLAVIRHPLMLPGLGITAAPSRVKDVITNSAALQVIRARFIVCLDFSALITGLLVWHWNSSCKIPVVMTSDKAPVCLWGAASFGLSQQASGAACR